MKDLKIPAFNEVDFTDHQENATARVVTIPNAEDTAFAAYDAYFLDCGFVKKEWYTEGAHFFAAYQRDTLGVFLNYYGGTRELRIVIEENCLYFSYTDAAMPAKTAPKITQISLTDFGLSYVIHLSDGRFIVIDGGRNKEPDQDSLLACLESNSNGEKPVIAAWLMSHPHKDHYHCFLGFMERYADRVIIERFMLNFPEADDLVHYPLLAKTYGTEKDESGITHIPRMFALIEQTGAPTYMLHTGQRYKIGDADCEVLSTLDDTIHIAENINATSVILRMELGGQVILWTTDASFSIAKFAERYGTYLKSDILQIPHHGFQSGTAEGEIAGYDLIEPETCLLPAANFTAFKTFCTYREGTRHILCKSSVQEVIAGTKQRTITLPYHPLPDAKNDLTREYLMGRDCCGTYSYIFSDLDTANEADFVFTFMNTTYLPATVRADLYFEDKLQNVTNIIATIPGRSLKRLSLLGDEVETESASSNPNSLKKQGVPENALFGVRFVSDVPIVITHKTHQAAYRSSANL